MTRSMNARWQCPNCKCLASCETGFERWMRENELLDSREFGIARFDLDVLIHRYKFDCDDAYGSRDIQALMFIEVKTHAAKASDAQLDTLSAMSQLLRNRKQNMYQDKLGRHAKHHEPLTETYSHILKKYVSMKAFGGHLLTLQKQSPDDSEWMTWDGKEITPDQLMQLLRFEIDPDTLSSADWRRRSKKIEARPLFE